MLCRYCHFGTRLQKHTNPTLAAALSTTHPQTSIRHICPNANCLPFDILPDNDPRKKKHRNSLKRKKNKSRKKNNQSLSPAANK